jgi:branched-chain amino acid transport system substrate-binding protein
LFALALALVTVALAATAALGARPAALRAGTIDVALLQPTSGPFAAHNLLLARGVAVAVQQLNEAGGIGGKVKVGLVERRLTANIDPGRTIASLGRNVRVVILPCNVDATAALAAAAARNKLLALAPCNPDPQATARIPLFWPVAMSGNQEAAQLVGYPAIRWNTKSAYILTSNPATAYETGLVRYLKRAARLVGIRIVGESTVSLTGRNLTALASTLRKSPAEVIFTPIFSPYVEGIIARLRKAKMLKAVLATDGMDAQLDLSRYGGNTLNNVSFASYGFPGNSSKAFFRAYKQQFHNVPLGSFPALGLETVRTLAAGITKSQSTDPVRISAAFAKGLEVSGVGFAGRRYLGGGAREPIAEVGIVDVIDGAYYASESSIPARIPAP